MAGQLPTGFEALEPFIARFAVRGTAARAALRGELSEAERAAFHAAARDLVGPALDRLDARPLDTLDEGERTLLALCLTFAHVALAVEIQGPDEARHAELRQHMRVTRSPADAFV